MHPISSVQNLVIEPTVSYLEPKGQVSEVRDTDVHSLELGSGLLLPAIARDLAKHQSPKVM